MKPFVCSFPSVWLYTLSDNKRPALHSHYTRGDTLQNSFTQVPVRSFERRTDEELELNLLNQNNSQAAQDKTATQSPRSVAMVKQ